MTNYYGWGHPSEKIQTETNIRRQVIKKTLFSGASTGATACILSQFTHITSVDIGSSSRNASSLSAIRILRV